ncbi:MAG: hypothetical protein IJ493_04925 [Clostridia bacterium]|nr:hypothetical protein [Clostridia bacterium]
MRNLILSIQAAWEYGRELEALGYDLCALPPDESLNRMVCTHADTCVFPWNGRLYGSGALVHVLSAPLLSRLVVIPDPPHGDYPDDVRLNALFFGDCLYAYLPALSDTVRRLAEESGLELVNVRQGYTRCSVLALPHANRAVTADRGIADAMEARGVQVLRISPDGILLNGIPYGFIGGASFVDGERIIFYGRLNGHPDGDAIRTFCAESGCEVIELHGALTDHGGAVVI